MTEKSESDDRLADALKDSLASLPENAHDAAMQRLEQIALGDTVLDIYGPGDPACEQCHGRGAIRGQFGRAQTVSRCPVCNAEKAIDR